MNDATRIADTATYSAPSRTSGQRRIALPTFAELAQPSRHSRSPARRRWPASIRMRPMR